MRQALRESIAHSPVKEQELYAAGSIVVCTNCAKPIYRLERGVYLGEKAGRSVNAFKPVRLVDMQDLFARVDVDAGVRAFIASLTPEARRHFCDTIATPKTGDVALCPKCKLPFMQLRGTELGEARDHANVWQLLVIPPMGSAGAPLRGGRVWID